MDGLERTLMTIGCPDTASLIKVPEAGRVVDTSEGPVQIMHNGLRVVAGGYHGDWMAHVIRALRGHHEPQEELIFDAILRYCRHNSLIVELGAFWSYYSLWYIKEIPGAHAICVEPDPRNLSIGVRNAELNDFSNRVSFHNAWVGGSSLPAYTLPTESTGEELTLPCFSIQDIVLLSGDETIEVLHMDVQGAELPFLQSMHSAVLGGKIRFLVVSTHHSSISGSKTTHEDCVAAIRQIGGTILIDHDVQESFSGDGLIVATFYPHDQFLKLPPISRNTARKSLFPEK